MPVENVCVLKQEGNYTTKEVSHPPPSCIPSCHKTIVLKKTDAWSPVQSNFSLVIRAYAYRVEIELTESMRPEMSAWTGKMWSRPQEVSPQHTFSTPKMTGLGAPMTIPPWTFPKWDSILEHRKCQTLWHCASPERRKSPRASAAHCWNGTCPSFNFL